MFHGLVCIGHSTTYSYLLLFVINISLIYKFNYLVIILACCLLHTFLQGETLVRYLDLDSYYSY